MSSEFEARVDSLFRDAGFRVLRRGWPDRLIVDESNGRAYPIELKTDSDAVSDEQTEMHLALRLILEPVKVLKPRDVQIFITELRRRIGLTKTSGNIATAKAAAQRAWLIAQLPQGQRVAVDELRSRAERDGFLWYEVWKRKRDLKIKSTWPNKGGTILMWWRE